MTDISRRAMVQEWPVRVIRMKIESPESTKSTPMHAVRSEKIGLPTCWRAPDPPVRRPNQDRLIGPSIVPNPQFSAAWKTQWRNATLIEFADF